MFQSEHPFTEFRLLTEGAHVLADMQAIEQDAELGVLIVADQHGQLGWQELVGERFAEFDYYEEHGIAIRWHVAGRQSPVIIDPRISFGAPTVRGIPTWAVKGRSIAGETLEDIKEDFGLEAPEVESALGFEGIAA